MKTRKSDKIIRAEGEVTPELFRKMVEEHDPTYLWSKNQTHIEMEREREFEIDKARKIIGEKEAVTIWNQVMRKKIVPSFVEQYLWKMERETIQ